MRWKELEKVGSTVGYSLYIDGESMRRDQEQPAGKRAPESCLYPFTNFIDLWY